MKKAQILQNFKKSEKNTDRTEPDPGRAGGKSLRDPPDHQQLGDGKKSAGH